MSTLSVMGGRKTALITGASGGIGYALAKVFAGEGFNLVLVARGVESMQALAGELKAKNKIDTLVIAKDLTRPDAPKEIFEQIQQTGISIDALVNNAGYATYGNFAELDLARELDMIQVNIATLTHLTRLFLPGMLERKYGRILNVASTAAFQPGPLMAVYYATKAFVLSFSEAIADELDGSGVTVTALCPGPTASGFQQRANMEDSRLVSGKNLMTGETVARAGYKALMKGKRVEIPGRLNALMTLAPRFLPRKMVTKQVHKMQARNH